MVLHPELMIPPRLRFIDHPERIAELRFLEPVLHQAPFSPFILLLRIEIIPPMVLALGTVFHDESPVEAGAALLGDHLDHTGLGIAILGVKAAGDHLHLGDGQGIDVVFPAVVRFGAGAVGGHPGVGRQALHAVDLVVDLVGAAAADAVGAVGILVDPRGELEDVADALHRQGVDLVGIIMNRRGGLVGLDDGPRGGDGDRFPQIDSGGFKLGIDGGGAVDAHSDLGDRQRLIADVDEAQLMHARRYIEDGIAALHVRHRADGHAHHHDVGAGERLAGGGIPHLAGDLARRLGVQARRSGAQKQKEQKSRYFFHSPATIMGESLMRWDVAPPPHLISITLAAAKPPRLSRSVTK
ncbi:MAG: hypothetical protein BWY77_01867 [bacterium ADurb.Bin431]|nr:MAG: hypothetical protein BWY77_01867 [bacterium ADurb.Bin431]